MTKLDTILLNGNNIAVVRPRFSRCHAPPLRSRAPPPQLVPGGAPADA